MEYFKSKQDKPRSENNPFSQNAKYQELSMLQYSQKNHLKQFLNFNSYMLKINAKFLSKFIISLFSFYKFLIYYAIVCQSQSLGPLL